MARVSNNDVRRLVQERKVFTTHNGTIFSHNYTHKGQHWYVVYSYGRHFPMYIYDHTTGEWFGNWEKVSRTTTKHQNKAHPHCEVKYLSKRHMIAMADHGPREFVLREIAQAAGLREAA